MNYKEKLDLANKEIVNFKLNDFQELNTLNSNLINIKQDFIMAKEGSIEFYTYCAIQNICVLIDNCRDKYLDNSLALNEIEKELKSKWNEYYKMF